MKRVLLVDTTLRGAAVGLIAVDPAGRVEMRSAAYHFENYGSAASLSRLYEAVMDACQIGTDELDLVAVAHGPGSFTGLKVGLAFASGLVRGQQGRLPVIGISSLAAYASSQANGTESGRVACFLPSTRTQGYLCVAKDEAEPAIYIVDSGADRLELYEEGSRRSVALDVLQGAAITVVMPWLAVESCLRSMGHAWHTPEFTVLAASALLGMADEVASRVKAGLVADDRMPEPRYVRKSAPEEASLAKKAP